jgi:cytochrome P450
VTDAAVANTDAPSTPRPGEQPPAVPFPKAVQGVAFAGFRRWMMRTATKRYGPVFAINVPFFGRTVMMADPALVRQVFLASTDDLINVQPNLSRIFGPGSVFALDGMEHRNRRKLLAPPFHGQSIKNYEKVIEEETLRESANWPEGKEFRTPEPMNRITLNVILRTVFGAEGVELDYASSCTAARRPSVRLPRPQLARGPMRVGPAASPGVAASSPAAGSGRCSRRGSARGSPDARARPPRSRSPASPR